MHDYSTDIRLIQRLHRFAIGVDAAELATKPVLAAAKLLNIKRLETALGSVEVLDNWASGSNRIAVGIWRLKYKVEAFHRSHAIRALAKSGPFVGSLDEAHARIHYHDVFGIPVAPEPYEGSEVFYSPASPAEIFRRVRESGSRWRIDKDGGMHVDDAEIFPVRARQTTELIKRIRDFDGRSRAVILWGPPRGGKSVAARQIAESISGGWVRICGRAAASADVWEAVHELEPEAIILDDLDTCAQHEDDLLGWLEGAREYTKVIVSTMNILPGTEAAPRPAPPPLQGELIKAHAYSERRSHELRGALLAPGRACDEEPRLYAELDVEVRVALAPDVPEHLRPSDLLAAYLVELQARTRLPGGVTDADLEEMRARMKAVGDR